MQHGNGVKYSVGKYSVQQCRAAKALVYSVGLGGSLFIGKGS